MKILSIISGFLLYQLSIQPTVQIFAQLKESNWNKRVKSRLDKVLVETESKNCAAVFDFDNTIVCGDIGEAVFEELINDRKLCLNNVRFASPAFVNNESLVAIESYEDVINYYENLLTLFRNDDDKTPYISAYTWASEIMSGIDINRLAKSAEKVMNDNRIGAISPPRFPTPVVYYEMIELIANLLKNEVEIFIISASNVWIVRYYVLNKINIMLREGYGIKDGIKPENIFGMNNLVKDKRDGRFYKDEFLVKNNKNYANMEETELVHYEITSLMDYPIPSYFGKSAIVNKFFSSKEIILSAGDSPNDFAMLRQSKYKLWLARLEKTEYQKQLIFEMSNDHEDLIVQPVLTKIDKGFVKSLEELKQKFKDKSGIPERIESSLLILSRENLLPDF